jgi:pilus assembly protein Flp/PilA
MLKHFVSAQNALVLRLRSDRGATAVEYGLLVALIAAVIIGIVIIVGKQVSNAFNSVSSEL